MTEGKSLTARRPLFFAAVAYGLGLLVGARLRPAALVVFLLCAALAVGGAFLRRRASGRLLLLAGLFFAAMGAVSLALSPALPALDIGAVLPVSGRVCEISAGEKGVTYLLREAEVGGQPVSGGVLLRSSEDDFALSDIISASATVRLPEGAADAFAFDDELYCASRGAVLRAYAQSVAVTGHARDALGLLHDVRTQLAAGLDELFGPQADTAKAFLLGVTWEMDAEERAAFRETGVSHLLSVSGLHVAALAGAALLLLRLCRAGRRTRFAVLAVLLALYALLTGLRASVVRAALMFFLWQLGVLIGRRNDGLTALAAAFLAAVLADPAAVFDVGFQLSYGAVFSILTLAGPLRRRLPAGGRLTGKLWGLLAVNLAVNLGTLPLLLRISSGFWLPSAAVNLLAVPYAGVMIPLVAALAVLGGLISPLASLAGALGRPLIALLEGMAGFSAAAPGARLLLPALPGAFVLALFILLFFLSPHFRGGRRTKITALCCAVGLTLLGLALPLLPRGEVRVDLLDVGGGDAALITLEDGGRVLVGAGSGSSTRAYLERRGIWPRALFLTGEGRRLTGALGDLAAAGRTGRLYAPAGRALAYSEKYALPCDGLHAAESVPLSGRCVLRAAAVTSTARDLTDADMALILQIDGRDALLFAGETDTAEGKCIPILLGNGASLVPGRAGLREYRVEECGQVRLTRRKDGWEVETRYGCDAISKGP